MDAAAQPVAEPAPPLLRGREELRAEIMAEVHRAGPEPSVTNHDLDFDHCRGICGLEVEAHTGRYGA